jgi:hypothetical protein
MCELNGFTLFSDHRWQSPASLEHDVSLLTNSVYDVHSSMGAGYPLHVIRNPMSVVVSAYYSHLSSHPTTDWPELLDQRLFLQRITREDGLAATLEFLERPWDGNPGVMRAMGVWNYDDPRIITVRLEDITAHSSSILSQFLRVNFARNVKLPHAENYSFEKMSGGRKIGEVDNTSHYRSGNAEGWREELPKRLQDYIRMHYTKLLKTYYPEVLS